MSTSFQLFGWLRFARRWYNSTAPLRSDRNPVLGIKRETMAAAARGSVVVIMDNDDVYHPTYVRVVVDEFHRKSRPAEQGSRPLAGLSSCIAVVSLAVNAVFRCIAVHVWIV